LDHIDEVFGSGGILSRKLEGYEPRPGQMAMARAVDEAIREERHLIVEAPCGVGKSLSYSVPAAWHATNEGRRVVIATANIALQEQLVGKDLPFLKEALPWDFSFALIKGRSNYLCLKGSTRILTRQGVKPISSLSGDEVELLDGDGKWVKSPVRSYGKQRLHRIVLKRNRQEIQLYATGNHRWLVQQKRDLAHTRETNTLGLEKGDLIPVRWPRPIVRKLRPSPFGVAAGATFGDGTLFGETTGGFRTATLVLHGKKNQELLKFFPESHTKDLELTLAGYAENATRVCDLPCFFRKLPDINEAPSYLYGWLVGYFAADGCVDKDGKEVSLSSAKRENLEFVERLCLLLGIATGGIRASQRLGIGQDDPSPLYVLPFIAASLDETFFVLKHHREHFKRKPRLRRTRMSWKVAAVERTDIVEEVYCAEVPTTNSFVLENYIVTGNCVDQWQIEQEESRFKGRFNSSELSKYRKALKWAARTVTGDKSELDFSPDRFWHLFSVGSDDCKGRDCRHFGECFAEKSKADAERAGIFVTNYHMLFAHLAIRAKTQKNLVLPPFDVAICDEAHKMADIARDFNGFRLTEGSARFASRLLGRLQQEELYEALSDTASKFFVDLEKFRKSSAYRVRFRSPPPLRWEGLREALGSVAGALHDAGILSQDRDDKATFMKASATAERMSWNLQAAMTMADPGWVYFAEEMPRGGAALMGKPIHVAGYLRDEFFGKACSVIMTSATLSVGGGFDHIAGETGVPDPEELIVESPFDFRKQALLIVPEGMPPPNDKGFPSAAADAVAEAVRLADGRVLGLFTSYRGLNTAHSRLLDEFLMEGKYTILRQGDRPRMALVEEFRKDVRSVLLGTESFWTGVDVPGEALSCVVIDRLPFQTPDDPVLDAIAEKNPGWFMSYSVPRAVISLKQGVGRLIRRTTDRGVVVLLDERVVSKPYGRVFLASLPPVMKSRKLKNIKVFLDM
jgi:ATP-dependent DNA helicase DinG